MDWTVVGHFQDAAEAQIAVADLESAGFTSGQIGYLSHDGTGPLAAVADARKSSGSRAAKGTVVGGVAGTLLGMAALAIPGVGPVLAAGPFAMALAGAGVGAATGGLLGAMSEFGIPDSEAKKWAQKIEHGGTIVAVRVNEDTCTRAIGVLGAHSPEAIVEHNAAIKETTDEYHPDDPHSEAPNYGDEGSASEWGVPRLREPDETRDLDRSRVHQKKKISIDHPDPQ